MFPAIIRLLGLSLLALPGGVFPLHGADVIGRRTLPDHVPTIVAKLTPLGRAPATNRLHLTLSLPLRNQPELDDLIRQLYDPGSPNFRQFLTPAEFTERFGPSEADYASLLDFAQTNGFQLTGTQPNRVLVDVAGSVATVERVFAVTLHTYRHPREARDFYAPDTAPSVAAAFPLLNVSGLDNYSIPQPKSVIRPLTAAAAATPRSGSGSGGAYIGNDFRAAYVPGTSLTGTGQSVALLQFDGYYANDIAAYLTTAGYPSSLINVLSNIAVNGGVSTPGGGNAEVCLDIEMVMSMAPGVSKIYVYEGSSSTSWASILSKIANDNLARQVSCSWGNTSPGSPDPTSEGVFKQMAAQGQSFFNASGDSDAFVSGIPFPAESTNITQVGGTTLSTTGPGGDWAAETAWNWGGTGTGGGVSLNYGIPIWQQGLDMTANQGSTTRRNVPDVALTGDNVYVAYNNGGSGTFGGTSCAAPLWAAFTALVNQQAALAAQPPVGFVNPALYAIGKGSNYNACFHDTTFGNNFSTSSPTNFPAVTGFDLCTGWGSPTGTNLINLLTPLVFAPAIAAGNWRLLAESATPTNGAIDPGETVTVSFALRNKGSLATSNLVATLQANAGVLQPGGPQTLGALAAYGGSNTCAFTFTAAGSCGSNLLAALQLQDGTNNLGTVSFALPLGKVFGLAQNFDAVTAPSLPAGWSSVNVTDQVANWATSTTTVDTAPNSAFMPDATTPGENALVSPSILISSTTAQLSFRQNYSLEYTSSGFGSNKKFTYYDGGVLEIQMGNGEFTDILAAGGSFVTGGYNASLATSSDNPLGGRSAWVGSATTWKTVTVNLPPAAAGHNIQLRWNCATDTQNGGGSAIGWYVDSVSISDAVSTCLTVLTDLAVSQALATNSLQSGQNLVYTLTVTNLGPQAAANVVLTDTVPANMTFVSASPGCTYAAGQVICPAGRLPAAAATNFTVTFAPTDGGAFTNVVSGGTVTPELSTANNTATLVSTQSNPTPPGLTAGPASQLIECGGNAAFAITVTGTPPVSIQWTEDGIPVSGATNSTLLLANAHLPNHLVSVIVANAYGSVTNQAALTVQDTHAPVITLMGGNPLQVELGAAFTDAGATANDACAGTVPVSSSGTVNVNIVGTNTLTYTASDGNGNTNSVTRTVVVRDTTPPAIAWSFTNLLLAAGSNCVAVMPDVTGTNFVLATDLSGPLTISQVPTNGAALFLGTNWVMMAVSDVYSNTAFSTNYIIVQDQAPPEILTQPQSQTNFVGTTVAFHTAATACTPVTFQWSLGTNVLAGATNSTLTLSNLTLAGAGDYAVVASTAGGSSTSAVATLTVELPPVTVTLASSANPAGYNAPLAFTAGVLPATATGTLQFFINGAPFDREPLVAGQAASASLASLPRGPNLIAVVYSGDASYLPGTNSLEQIVTNHPPVAVAAFYTNAPGSGLEIPIASLAANWSDPDGDPVSLASVGVSTNGVTVASTGDRLIYSNAQNVADQFACTITDGFGGTNFQTVAIVPAPPAILSSFTRLVLAADTNCGAMMPDVTGTNFIRVSEFFEPFSLSQVPTIGAALALGTNLVVVSVLDSYGHTAYATNVIVVQDQTPPAILTQPQSQTNFVGTTVAFHTAATACTTATFQWLLGTNALAGATNSTLTLSNLTLAAAGDYAVVASAAGGSSTSAVATLTVELRPSSVTLASSANPTGFRDGLMFTAGVVPLEAVGAVEFFANGAAFDLESLAAGQTASTNLASLPRGTNLVSVIYSGDNTYLPATNWLVQVVTNHLPVAVSAFYTNAPGLHLNITITDLATNWSDADGDVVSLAGVSDSTNGIPLINTGKLLIYANTNPVADQFTCTITDGFGGTNFQTVFITFVNTTPIIHHVVASGNDEVLLDLGGAPGYTYILEATTNLFAPGEWLPLATNTLGTNGLWQFTDPQATNYPQRFYRLELAP